MSWLSKAWKKVTHGVEKVVKTVTKPVTSIVGKVFGGGAVSASETSSPQYQIAAPAVAAPEPTQGQEEADLVSKKKKTTSKGKKALLIDTGGSTGSGGTTGTGLNL